MMNCFDSTTEFIGSLNITEQVGLSLSTPSALQSAQLPITNAISCATVVLLSGYFENFLKNITKEFIEAINRLNKPLAIVPFSMQVRHYAGGADALLAASKKDKDLENTSISQDLTRRLGSLDKSTGYELVWESFANTRSNPGTETVSKLLAGLEINKPWPEINKLQTNHGRLDTFLRAFIEMRNICAHTGRHSTPPSGADIVDYVDKFTALAKCIDMILGIRLEEFATTTP